MNRMRFILPVLAILLIASLSRPSTATPQPAQVTLNWLTTPIGIGFYETATGVASLLAKKHSWLRANVQETQGFGYNFKSLATEAWRRKNTVAGGDIFTFSLAKKQIPPYNDAALQQFNPRLLWGEDWSMQFVLTPDPKIKTINDLKGRRVITAPKAGNFSAMSLLVMRYAGLFDSIKWQHMGFTDMIEAINSGAADACYAFVSGNPVSGKFSEQIMVTQAKASGKTYHIVPIPGELMDKVLADGVYLNKYTLQVDPLTGKPAQIGVTGQVIGTVTASELPEELAYELTKFMIHNMSDVNVLGGRARVWTKEGMVDRVADYLHPGSRKAFQEAGLLK